MSGVGKQHKTLASIFCCALGLLGALSSAQAFSIDLRGNQALRWATRTIDFETQRAGSDDIHDGSDLATVVDMANAWNQVSCANLTLRHTGHGDDDSTVVLGHQPDGINRITWIEDERWVFGNYVLGVTSPIFYDDGRIIEADIVLNGRSVTWSTDSREGTTHVAGVVLHELGHFLGIQHALEGNTLDNPPTMSPANDPWGRSATLHDDDRQALCFLYPQESYRCDSTADCPRVVRDDAQGREHYLGQLNCSGRYCSGLEPVEYGTDGLGARCGQRELSCSQGLFCQSTGTVSYCSDACEPHISDSCPDTFLCVGTPEGRGACLPAAIYDPNNNDNDISNACRCDDDASCTPGCSCDPHCQAREINQCQQCGGGCQAFSAPNQAMPLRVLILLSVLGFVLLRQRQRKARADQLTR